MTVPVITWMRTVNPLGRSLEEFSRRMFAGESGVRGLESVTADPSFPVSCAGLIESGFFPPIAGNEYVRETELLLGEMLRGGLDGKGAWEPVDTVIFGTNDGIGKLGEIARFGRDPSTSDLRSLRAEYGIEFALMELAKLGQPPVAPENQITCVNGCVTGILAIGYAAERIRLGRSRRVLVIGNETRVREEDLLKYNALGALSREKGPPGKVSRPFSRSRSGFVKGEGGGMLLLEARELAEKRGARPYASVLGFAAASDAWRLTDGRDDMGGMVSAMRMALARAGVEPGAIDYVNAHGTSTPMNDLFETRGLKLVFGEHAAKLAVSSLKSQIGHLNYACGMVETIATALMLREQRVAPTLNYDPDPECDLHYVPEKSEPRKLERVLKNSFGFGGANASLVLGRS